MPSPLKKVFAKISGLVVPQDYMDQALVDSAQAGDNAKVKFWLAAGAEVHGVKGGGRENALGAALVGCHLETVKLLAESGADLNFDGGRALRVAASQGDTKTVSYLVSEKGLTLASIDPDTWAFIRGRNDKQMIYLLAELARTSTPRAEAAAPKVAAGR